MKVADSSPASWPSVASSTSTLKPRRSAQRWYMRSSISVQSCASVPPAPACTSHTASNSSYSPANSDCSSSAPSRVAGALGGRLPRQLQQRLRVPQRAAKPVELLEVGRDPPQLLRDRPCGVLVV